MAPETQKVRRYPRYQVMDYSGIKTKLGFHSSRKMVTIGEGGCGFFALEEMDQDPLYPPKVLSIEIEFQGDEPICLEGEVIYCRLIQMGNRLVRYYGVQFNQAALSQTKALAGQIERLAAEGRLAEA